jgi:predicted RNase H-like HicB family nuclease
MTFPKELSVTMETGRTGKETTMTVFTIVIEDAGTNFAAYAPDVPRCTATGATVEEVTTILREAIGEHLEIRLEMGEEIPVPHSRAGVIQIAS